MKKTKGAVPSEKITGGINSRAMIEGELSRKPSQPEIYQILLLSGRSVITVCDTAEGFVNIEGKVYFNTVYADMTGDIYSFESSANFKHKAECGECKKGMSANANCTIKNIDYKLMPSGSVQVKAYGDICVYIFESETCEIITGIEEGEDTFMREEKVVLPKKAVQKNVLSTIKEDIRLPQNMPVINKILDVEGYGVIKSIHCESMKITCEGEMRYCVIYETSDKNAPLQSYSGSLPIGEIIGAEGAEENADAFAFCEITDIAGYTYDESSDTFALEASVKIHLCAYLSGEYSVITDVYDISKNISKSASDVYFCSLKDFKCVKTIMRDSVTLPQGSPEAARIVFARGNAEITDSKCCKDYIKFEGNVYADICYYSTNGGMATAAVTIPFCAESAGEFDENCEIISRVNVEYIETEGFGRDIDVKYSLEICYGVFDCGRKTVLADCEYDGSAVAPKEGITVYFAKEGDTLWDICSKFKVSGESVTSFNKNVDFSAIEQGEKIIVF